jgi:hypothetical protein
MGQEQPSPEELNSATMATLTCTPASPEAAVLVEHLVVLIHSQESRSGTRQRARRREDLNGLYTAVGALIADLLIASGQRRGKGLVYRSLNANSFSRGPVAFRQFKAALAGLEALGLIECFEGYYRVQEFQWSEGVTSKHSLGRASRFRATQALLALASQLGVQPKEARKHFRQQPSERLITLKAKSRRVGRNKVTGEAMPVPNTPEVDRICEQVRTINAFMEQVMITGGEHHGFYRGFEHGDQPGFHWNKGGRLYSIGPDNYQRMKETERLRMTLNGEGVVEIDIKSSYLTILHGRAGVPLDLSADPYSLPGMPRSVVKGWLVATLGNQKHLTRWPAHQAEEYLDKTGRSLSQDYPISSVRAAITAMYPILSDMELLGASWADLMFMESEAIIRTVLKLIDQGIPSLPVHDSLLVPVSAMDLTCDLLEASYQDVAGIRPVLEISYPH